MSYYKNDTTRSCSLPPPDCSLIDCQPNHHCEMVQVQCVTTPCDPQPTCVPDLSCAAVLCAPNTTCVETSTGPKCVANQPGACTQDSDCRLEDDYCGGCACRALGPGDVSATCSNPVACFVQPCSLFSKAVCENGFCKAVH